MSVKEVYLIGPRYEHHARCSGYENFRQHLDVRTRQPVSHRMLAGKLGHVPGIGDLGWRIDRFVCALTTRPFYTLGILTTELLTALHMMSSRGSVYHVIYGDTDIWLLSYMPQITRNKLVATFHEPCSALEWFKVGPIAARVDAVILVSESQREYFEAFVAKERIHVIPHGIDTGFYTPAEQLSPEPVCITVGSKLRDFKTLTAAIDLILTVKPNVRFLAIGTQRKAGGHPHLSDPRVEYMSNLSDVELREAYREARIGLFPLSDATANNSLLEAMACGLPIVTSDVGGVREYVGGAAARLCPRSDPWAIAQAVLELLDDDQKARDMARASRRRAEKFDYRIVAAQMKEFYDAV